MASPPASDGTSAPERSNLPSDAAARRASARRERPPARRPPPARRGHGAAIAVAAVLIVAALVLLLYLGAFHISIPGLTQTKTSSPPGGSSPPSGGCPAQSSTPASYLYIPSTMPRAVTAPAGSVLIVAYEIKSETGSDAGAAVEMPGVTADFPNNNGPAISLFLPARTLNLASGSWTQASFTAHSRVLTSEVNFTTNDSPFLTTELIAVMSSANVGTLTLEVTWTWNLTIPGSTVVSGGWTTPSSSTNPPSIFEPQPYVQLVGHSGSSEAIGALFVVSVSGAVPGESFLLKLENASNGMTENEVWTNVSASASQPVSLSIPVQASSGSLQPGAYLVHVHNACGGILYSLTVQASNASPTAVHAGAEPTFALARPT